MVEVFSSPTAQRPGLKAVFENYYGTSLRRRWDENAAHPTSPGMEPSQRRTDPPSSSSGHGDPQGGAGLLRRDPHGRRKLGLGRDPRDQRAAELPRKTDHTARHCRDLWTSRLSGRTAPWPRLGWHRKAVLDTCTDMWSGGARGDGRRRLAARKEKALDDLSSGPGPRAAILRSGAAHDLPDMGTSITRRLRIQRPRFISDPDDSEPRIAARYLRSSRSTTSRSPSTLRAGPCAEMGRRSAHRRIPERRNRRPHLLRLPRPSRLALRPSSRNARRFPLPLSRLSRTPKRDVQRMIAIVEEKTGRNASGSWRARPGHRRPTPTPSSPRAASAFISDRPGLGKDKAERIRRG